MTPSEPTHSVTLGALVSPLLTEAEAEVRPLVEAWQDRSFPNPVDVELVAILTFGLHQAADGAGCDKINGHRIQTLLHVFLQRVFPLQLKSTKYGGALDAYAFGFKRAAPTGTAVDDFIRQTAAKRLGLEPDAEEVSRIMGLATRHLAAARQAFDEATRGGSIVV